MARDRYKALSEEENNTKESMLEIDIRCLMKKNTKRKKLK